MLNNFLVILNCVSNNSIDELNSLRYPKERRKTSDNAEMLETM